MQISLSTASSRALFAILYCGCRAEDGHEGWLRYAPLDSAAAKSFASTAARGSRRRRFAVLRSAQEELARGLHGMLGITLAVAGG